MKIACENNGSDIDEKLLAVEILLFAFVFDSDATLLDYSRHAESTERLHWHCVKVKSSTLLAQRINKW